MYTHFMKQFFKQSINITLAMAFFAFALVGFSSTAHAGWNDASSGECPTFSIGNNNTGEGITNPCWSKTTVSASVGDYINVKVYFHNNTGASVNDVKVRVNDARDGSGNVPMSGTVFANGTAVAVGSGSVSIPSDAKLVYTRTILQYQGANREFTPIDKGGITSVFYPNAGLPVGPIASTWADQGVIKVIYQVVKKDVVVVDTGTKPTAYTSTPTVNSSQGYATLKGSFTSGNLATTTCFQYRIVGTSSYTEVSCMNNGIADGDRNYQVTNLPTGNYEYRIIATNSVATANGNWVPFSINTGGVIVIDDNYYPTVTTNPATNTSNASTGNSNGYAVLNGTYDADGDTNFQTAFEINGTRNGAYIYGPKTFNQTFRGNTNGSISTSLGDLPAGYYEYRIIGLPTTGSKIDGFYKYFTINENNIYVPPVIIYPQPPIYYPPVTGYGAPTVTTLPVFNFNNTEANLDGYVNGNGCATTTWFEYGNYAYSLSNKTNEIARGSGAGNAMQYVSGLSPSTMYYYRLAARNCTGNTVYGQTQSFTTANTVTRRIVQSSTVITRQSNNTTIVNGSGGNTKMVRLSIDNARTTMTRGEQVMYTVIWENVSNVVLNNLVLEVTMPKELKIMTTSRGDIDHSTNAVYLNIVRLDPQEEGQMFITANLNGNLQAGDPVVARAIMAFENSLLNGAADSAVEYDADSYITGNNVGLGASIFGIGFLPSNLIGWLIIFLIIFLIVIAARHYVRTGRDDRDGTTTSSTSYTTYRPTQ